MTEPKSSLRKLIESYSDNIVMLDGVYMWAQNPTSMSAGYGIDENYSFIEETLNIRYSSERTNISVQEKGFHETVELLQEEMDLITDEYSQAYSKAIYKVRSHVKELFEELDLADGFRDRVKSRIQKANERDQLSCLLFAKLLETKFNTHSKNKIRTELRPSQFERFSIYFRALFDRKPPSTDVFTELGVFNKLQWISSGSGGREPRYCIPEYLEPVILGMEDYVAVSEDTPDIQTYLRDLFDSGQIASFEQLLFGLDEGISENTGLDFPLKNGIIHRNKEYYVVSPFVEEELRSQYKEHRTQHLKENSKVQSVLTDLRESLETLDKRYRPKSEFVGFTLDKDTVSYQSRLVLEDSTIDVVLTDYLSELSRQNDFGHNTLLFLVNQRIPEAERQLEQVDKAPSAVLVYGSEMYGLTSIPDQLKEVLSELAIRGYDLREIEIEDVSASPTQRDFDETIDQYLDQGLWKGAVQQAGSEIENRIHKVYRENSQLADPDQHKQVIDQMGPMDEFGLGNWIGYYNRTNLFERLEENYDIDRRYFDSEYLDKINELYKKVKHPPHYNPSPREAREVATIARNIVEETKPYLNE